MACNKRLPTFKKKVTILTTDDEFHWDESGWNYSTGVATVDFLADLRNTVLGTSAAISVKPAIQFAQVRTDRPHAGAVITAGSVITGDGLTHYLETLSAGSKFWWRRGLRTKLAAGSFAQTEIELHTAFRSCGTHFPTREIEIFPFNTLAASVRYIPITSVLDTSGVNVAKGAIVVLDNANNKLDFRLAGRAFNDPLARGAWVDLEAGWSTPPAGDSVANTGEVSLSGLSLSSNQFMELGVATRKDVDGSANSRCILHITPAIKYS